MYYGRGVISVCAISHKYTLQTQTDTSCWMYFLLDVVDCGCDLWLLFLRDLPTVAYGGRRVLYQFTVTLLRWSLDVTSLCVNLTKVCDFLYINPWTDLDQLGKCQKTNNSKPHIIVDNIY